VRRFIEAAKSGRSSNLEKMVAETPDKVTSKVIYEEALKGDRLSREIMEETGFFLGVGIVTILHFLNPQRVVLAGGMVNAGPMLMDPLKRTVEERAFSRSKEDVEIVFARLGEDAGFIGAAGCALIGSAISAS
jgi:glucokinase